MNQHDMEECRELRKNIFIAAYKGGVAHLASCFSAVEIIYTLYCKNILKFDSNNPNWSQRDRFVLSKGHGGLALYAVLWKVGYITKEEYFSYLQRGCSLGGEPCMRDEPGIEATTGSLGHGLPMAVGMALAQKIDNINAKTYVLLGDGECQEGSIWEAAMAASSFELGNLIAILDYNKLQKTKDVNKILKKVDWIDKWNSFGWSVLEIDGHDTDDICNCLNSIESGSIPTMVIANTIKGKGVSIMENNSKWHFKMPNKKEIKFFKDELQISDEELI